MPFLDPLVTNFALRAADAAQGARARRRSGCCARPSEPLLPREVVHGRKRGFSIPAAAWLRGELEPFARETLSPEHAAQRQGYLQPGAGDAVLDEHVRGGEDLRRQLWGLLAFTLWYERHVEGVTREVAVEALVSG